MATIFHVEGYKTMRECVGKLKQYVEVCAYKALCAAMSRQHHLHDDSWYADFLEKERQVAREYVQAVERANQEPDPRKKALLLDALDEPIPVRNVKNLLKKKNPDKKKKPSKDNESNTDEEGFILQCSALDMQAFMKILKFRPAYRKRVMDHFGIDRETAFLNVCDQLISYRNKEFAHLPVEASEKELARLTEQEEQKIIENCDESIRKFFDFLRLFPQLGAEDAGLSYYDAAYQKWCNAKQTLNIEEVELKVIIQREHLAVDLQNLIALCQKCGITVVITETRSYLLTGNYAKTVKLLRTLAQLLAQKEAQAQSQEELERELEKLRAQAWSDRSEMERELEKLRAQAWSDRSEMETALEKTRADAKSNRKRLITVICLCVMFIGILVGLLLMALDREESGQSRLPTEAQQRPEESPLPSQSQQLPAETTQQTAPKQDGPVFISGSGSYGGLTFQVNQMKSPGILLNYTNDGATEYSLGWVGGAQVDVKTTVGTFTVTTEKLKILRDSSGSFAIDLGQELMGQIQAITVRGILPLSASGLPAGNECTVEILIQEGSSAAPVTTVSKVIRGQGSHKGLVLTVDQKLSSGISVRYENGGEHDFSLGWVQSAKVQIQTTEANVEGVIAGSSLKIEKETTGSFVIEVSGQIPGQVQKIVIHNVNVLTASGLPDPSGRDQTVTIPITQTEE